MMGDYRCVCESGCGCGAKVRELQDKLLAINQLQQENETLITNYRHTFEPTLLDPSVCAYCDFPEDHRIHLKEDPCRSQG